MTVKKINELVDALNISFNHVKECQYCHRPVKGYKDITSDNGKCSAHIPVFACDCYDKLVNESEAEREKRYISELMKGSNIDNEFLVNDFPVYRDEVKQYHENLYWIKAGMQLLIYGNPGNHKTGHVTAIMKKAIKKKKHTCLYYRASELPKFYLDYPDKHKLILNCDLLVLDNFAKEPGEKFGGIIFDILDKRIHRFKSNILILNTDKYEAVEQIYKAPMTSRLKGFIQIEMDGKDKRENVRYGSKEVKSESSAIVNDSPFN